MDNCHNLVLTDFIFSSFTLKQKSLTAAGCYLCPAPGAKGMNLLVCFSPDFSQLSSTKTCQKVSTPGHLVTTSNFENVISEAKANAESAVQHKKDLPFLRMSCSESIVSEATKLKFLSESSCDIIVSLQKEETEHFHSDTRMEHNHSTYRTYASANSFREYLECGQLYYLFDRFLVAWKIPQTTITNNNSPMDVTDCNWDLNNQSKICLDNCGIVNNQDMAFVRLMVEDDWIQLSELSKGHIPVAIEELKTRTDKCQMKILNDASCLDSLHRSAGKALLALKSIPVSARRALPVLVSSEGLLLSIPSMSYTCCPHLSVLATFRPRVPITGGFSTFL